MSDESTGGTTQGTAGLREAALAKGRPTAQSAGEAPAQPQQRAANDNAAERPQFKAKATPAADAIGDANARAAKKK